MDEGKVGGGEVVLGPNGGKWLAKERGTEKGLPYSPEWSKSGLHSCSLYRAKIGQ